MISASGPGDIAVPQSWTTATRLCELCFHKEKQWDAVCKLKSNGGTLQIHESLPRFTGDGWGEGARHCWGRHSLHPHYIQHLLLCKAVSDGDHEATCTDNKWAKRSNPKSQLREALNSEKESRWHQIWHFPLSGRFLRGATQKFIQYLIIWALISWYLAYSGSLRWTYHENIVIVTQAWLVRLWITQGLSIFFLVLFSVFWWFYNQSHHWLGRRGTAPCSLFICEFGAKIWCGRN